MSSFVSEASFWMPEWLVDSAWIQHAPFAFWLAGELRPRTFVELGTHNGYSYFAFNQALRSFEAKTRCFAVDTWKGDEHSGFYGEDVYENVNSYNATNYADTSELVRCTFDDGVQRFQEASIDLLHIDGRHFYEDVKHDFETWKSKLSSRAVVLLHDTNVRVADFGVYRLWDELKEVFPAFEFLEGHGLGVLGVGVDLPGSIRDLFDANREAERRDQIRRIYSRLGQAILDRYLVIGKSRDEEDTRSIVNGNSHPTINNGFSEPSLKELQEARTANEALQSRLQELQKVYDQLSQNHSQLDLMYHELHNQNQNLGASVHRLEADYTLSTQARDSEKIELENRHQAERDQFAHRVNVLKSEKEKCEQALHRLQVKVSDTDSTVAALRLENQRLAENSLSIGETAKALSNANLALQMQLASALKIHDDLAKEYASQSGVHLKDAEALVKANDARNFLTRKCETLESDLRGAFELLDKLSAELSLCRANYHQATEALASTMKDLQTLQEGVLETAAEQSNSRAEAVRLTNELEMLKSSRSWRMTAPLRAVSVRFLGRSHVDQSQSLCLQPNGEPDLLPIESSEHALLRESGLFDVDFYLQANRSPMKDEADPIQHFLNSGASMRLDPHPLFDTNWYLTTNRDVAEAGVNPLVHFLSSGRRENRSPHPLFDPEFYIAQVEDGAPENGAFAHFMSKGWTEGLDPHPLFDSSWYLQNSPDVAAQRVMPLEHYCRYGWEENRSPHRLFDPGWYLSKYLDIAQSKVDPLKHYVLHGADEGRWPHPLFNPGFYAAAVPDVPKGMNLLIHYVSQTSQAKDPHALFSSSFFAGQSLETHNNCVTPLESYLADGAGCNLNPHPLFDAAWYCEENPQVKRAKSQPLIHYVQYGWIEKLSPHPLFDVRYYLEQNGDVANAEVEPLSHYLEIGACEDRDPHPLFQTRWYKQQRADLANIDENPLVHYLLRGAQEGLNPNPYFDSRFYQEDNSDVLGIADNPLVHYLIRGASQARDPSPVFDTDWYLNRYPSVRIAGLNPLVHYVRWGKREGRDTCLWDTGSVRARLRRIVFVSGEPQTPGHYYRVANLASCLPSQFFQTVILKRTEIYQRINEVIGSDIVWIWRATWADDIGTLVSFAREQRAVVIFDVDDLMFRPELAKTEIIDGIRTQDLTEIGIQEFYSAIRATVGHAAHCTAPTTVLAHELRQCGKPATLIPNGFDRRMLRTARSAVLRRLTEPPARDVVRIGYAGGTMTHQKDLACASTAIAEVLKENPSARLVLFRETIDLSEFPELKAVEPQIEWRGRVPVEELPYEYARFDINIAPLQAENPYCEAKSELKFFEAALVKVPTIASPTRPFREAIKDGETGLIAGSEGAWRDCLTRLISDKPLRDRLAAQAHVQVLWLYGPERRALLLTRLIDQLSGDSSLRSQLFALNIRNKNEKDIPKFDVPAYDVLFESFRANVSKVSVIIPVFNYAHFLPEALESVRNQTRKDIDLIVVDDRSTDNSLVVARTWLEEHASEFNRVALLQNRMNSKLGRSRNVGVAFCETEFYLPLDPDNILLPDCIEKSLRLLDQSGAAFAYPTINIFGDQNGQMGLLTFDPALFQCGNYIDAMAMVRKACWIAVGGYSPLEPVGWEDFDFWCKLVERGLRGVRVDDVIAKYRLHGTSMLRTITELPTNKPRVIRDLNSRHDWLDLPAPHAEENGGSRPRANTSLRLSGSTGSYRNLEYLIRILRCPETGEELSLIDPEALVNCSRTRKWPIVLGRPVFTTDGADVLVHPESHLSNELAEGAVEIIEQTSGPVLNLSAGGTAIPYPNVIELEYSIFRNTSVVGDVHRLPFRDEVFEAVVCLNAFEHYREPVVAMAEIKRILKPGGKVFIHTAFLQPLHEAPHHYYDCTEFGLREWLRDFSIHDVRVSRNFNPVYTLSWLASEMEFGFSRGVSERAAQILRNATLREFIAFWRNPQDRRSALWEMFYQLSPATQRQFAAGWEAIATKS